MPLNLFLHFSTTLLFLRRFFFINIFKTSNEIYREAELLHADDEQLADEVLGRSHDDDDNNDNDGGDLNDGFGGEDRTDLPTTPGGTLDVNALRATMGLDTNISNISNISNKEEEEQNKNKRNRSRRRRSSVLRTQLGISLIEPTVHSFNVDDEVGLVND